MQEKIFELLFDKDEITWQSIILDLIKTEQMDPWDINISLLSQKYIQMLKKLKDLDFRISGKIVLAAAILLRIKSSRLVGEDITELDRLLAGQDLEELQEDFYEELENEFEAGQGSIVFDKPVLTPRTPQPRKRKVSVYDLIDALQKALELKKRRVMRNIPAAKIEVPKKTVEITSIIREVYEKITGFFFKNNGKKLTFTKIIPSDSKEDKVLTFIPLLHLTNQRKINLLQREHFGEIEIILNRLRAGKLINEELNYDKKEIKPEQYFVFNSGIRAKNLKELAEQLDKIDKKTFKHHVNNKKNDFSNWINHVFNEKKLADELREVRTIEETKNKILEYIG
ncbi:MAG: segregation/condensation protein A [Nanoarchaeota archaeon]|nr:segregation/condensation protein A [Nanoarchaeota archaeon]MBU4493445.1 segregation/condensation protein A [Nanoarchaeota archaeon]